MAPNLNLNQDLQTMAKAIQDEFTDLKVSRGIKRYLRAKRDGLCVNCMKEKAESDRSGCKKCRGLKEKRDTYPNTLTVDQLHKKWREKTPKIRFKFFKKRTKNSHHNLWYKGDWRSLKEISKINNVNYPMMKHWRAKGYTVIGSLKKTKKL